MKDSSYKWLAASVPLLMAIFAAGTFIYPPTSIVVSNKLSLAIQMAISSLIFVLVGIFILRRWASGNTLLLIMAIENYLILAFNLIVFSEVFAHTMINLYQVSGKLPGFTQIAINLNDIIFNDVTWNLKIYVLYSLPIFAVFLIKKPSFKIKFIILYVIQSLTTLLPAWGLLVLHLSDRFLPGDLPNL